ncbi:MAG: Rrf2 family transcriptional regulator, partial [Myxococcota bacterium]
RFAVAVHILTVLAYFEGKPVPSAKVARSVNTSPAVIRQIMMRLREAGLVDAQLGKGGGSFLARPKDNITLLDVYHATESSEVFCTHRNGPSEGCIIGRHILTALTDVTDRATEALHKELATSTIADMLVQVQDCEQFSLEEVDLTATAAPVS